MKVLAFAFVSLFAVLACAQESAELQVGPFTFKRPDGWQSVAVSSPMRKGQWNIPAAEGGKPAEITFFVFGSEMGGVKPNVERWLGQFDGGQAVQKVETREISGTKVTFVSTQGTFQSGMPGGPTTPMTDYALRGAMFEAGSEMVFVKLVGPATLVKGGEMQFEKVIAAAAASRNKS